MLNHIHGIIWIKEVEAIHEFPQLETLHRAASLEDRRLIRWKMLLPKVIGYFKMNTAKQINALRGTTGQPVWQRNYYKLVIRNEG